MDVDKPEDLVIAEEILQQRAASGQTVPYGREPL